uniref:Uncharacterized protein n=1 Tax=viral metagenome TaxID=1070528 RepID=A0A6C0KH18_9ZZZZ
MDAATTTAIVTGTCAISLFLVKYIVGCFCPGHLDYSIQCGCSKPNDINPLVTFKSLWEEKFIPEHEVIGKNKYVLAKKNTTNNTWDIDINDNTEVIHLYRDDDLKPETNNHFLKVKIRVLEGTPEMNLFVKRFRGSTNCWEFSKNKKIIYKEPIIFNKKCTGEKIGKSELFIKTLIGEGDVTKEQVGLTIKGIGKYIVEEAYYSGKKISILSCPNCCYSFYKCYNLNPRIIENEEENDVYEYNV